MSENVKHKPSTPLPWALRETINIPDNVLTIHRADKPLSVVVWKNAMHGYKGAGISRTNFTFMVHASNAYPKLIAALKDVTGGCSWPDNVRTLLDELGEL